MVMGAYGRHCFRRDDVDVVSGTGGVHPAIGSMPSIQGATDIQSSGTGFGGRQK
jgi:hypothetical protein